MESSLKEVKECDIHQVKDLLEKDEDFFLIDVREDREWIQGHILSPSSRKRNNEDIANLINNKESLIVLYCQGGYRSALQRKIYKKWVIKNALYEWWI